MPLEYSFLKHTFYHQWEKRMPCPFFWQLDGNIFGNDRDACAAQASSKQSLRAKANYVQA